MTLYQYEGCGYCRMVRQKMSELLLTYVNVNVPVDRRSRTEVMAVSGQDTVPVLVDGEVVLSDEDDILEYLENTYGTPRV
ncbi:MAG: glutathione S-transferase N-terminal domain-containing protein [Candidatus Sericytochromatia bacterium]|nr:glutathione S-transferase N-terminal domain-containing protein [Candidatus Tanganyikabacteria bacterium]